MLASARRRGHVHVADATRTVSGGGTGIVTVVAGAAHGERGEPETHGYNWSAVVRLPDNTPVLRVWPRRWSPKNRAFRLDVDHVPDGKLFAEHVLARLRLTKKTDLM